LTEKDYVKSDAADDSAHRLYERSQELLNEKSEKYRPDVEALFDELRGFVDAMAKDPENRRVIDSSRKVLMIWCRWIGMESSEALRNVCSGTSWMSSSHAL